MGKQLSRENGKQLAKKENGPREKAKKNSSSGYLRGAAGDGGLELLIGIILLLPKKLTDREWVVC